LAFGFVKIPYAIFKIAFEYGANQFPFPNNVPENVLWSIGAAISFSQGFLLVILVGRMFNLFSRLKEEFIKKRLASSVNSIDKNAATPMTPTAHAKISDTQSAPHDNNLDSIRSSDSEDGTELPLSDMLQNNNK